MGTRTGFSLNGQPFEEMLKDIFYRKFKSDCLFGLVSDVKNADLTCLETSWLIEIVETHIPQTECCIRGWKHTISTPAELTARLDGLQEIRAYLQEEIFARHSR